MKQKHTALTSAGAVCPPAGEFWLLHLDVASVHGADFSCFLAAARIHIWCHDLNGANLIRCLDFECRSN